MGSLSAVEIVVIVVACIGSIVQALVVVALLRSTSRLKEGNENPQEPKEPEETFFTLANGTPTTVPFNEDECFIEGKLLEISRATDDKSRELLTYTIEESNGERSSAQSFDVLFIASDIGRYIWVVVYEYEYDEYEEYSTWRIRAAGTDGIRSGNCPSCDAHLGNMKSYCEYCGTAL